MRAYCKRFFWCPLLRVNQLLFTSAHLLMEEIPLTSWYGKSSIICRVSYIPGGDRRISINSSFQTYGTWPLTNFTRFTRIPRGTGREGGRHCKRSALKVAEESNGCTSLPRFKFVPCQLQMQQTCCKTSKAGVRKFYPHGKFCQSRKKKNTHYLLYPFGWFLWPPKKHNSPSWWNNHLPVLPGVWVATRNAGILVIKVPPRLQGDFEAQMSQNLIVVGMVAWPTSILYTYYKYIYMTINLCICSYLLKVHL